MPGECMKIGDKEYVRVGDKLVEIDRFDENGKPVVKATSTEVRHPDGRVDVTVHVPCFQIAGKANKPK